MSLYSEHAQNVNRINERIAEIEAERIRRKGDLVGGSLALLGQLPLAYSQIKQQAQEQKRKDAQAAQQAELGNLTLQEKRATMEHRLDETAEYRRIQEALRQARTPLEVEQVYRQFDPEKADKVRERNLNAGAQILQNATAGNWAEALQAIKKYVPPELASSLPDQYPDTPDFSWKVQTVRDWISTPKDYVSANTPKPAGVTKVDTVDAQGRPVTRFVEEKPGTDYPKPPPAERATANPNEAALAVQAADADPAIAGPAQKALDILRKQHPPAASSSAKDAELSGLVDTVLENPALWDQLTPSAKGAIAPLLRAKGYDQFGKPLSDQAMKTIAESESALQSLNDLREVMKQNEQYIGPIAGLSAINPYSDARKAQANIDLVRQRVGKALEGGVLRKEDEEKYKKILATLTDTPETAIYKVDQLIKNIQQNVEQYKAAQRLGGRNVPKPKPAADETGAPKEGDTKPIPGYPGTEQTYRNGKWIRTK